MPVSSERHHLRGSCDGIRNDETAQTEHLLDQVGGQYLSRWALGDDTSVLHRDEMRCVAGSLVEVVKNGDKGVPGKVEVGE